MNQSMGGWFRSSVDVCHCAIRNALSIFIIRQFVSSNIWKTSITVRVRIYMQLCFTTATPNSTTLSPSIVSECSVRFRQLVHLYFLLNDSSLIIVRVHQFSCQSLVHSMPSSLSGSTDQPVDG